MSSYDHYTLPKISNDRKIFVYETFEDFTQLRDGSTRDLSVAFDVVIDIEHNYQILNDINELLRFKTFYLPKSWRDNYDDLITLTQEELVYCLENVLNDDGLIN